MIRLVVMKRGGQPGEVAINPARVTHVGSALGPYTDIWFGDQRIAVEGSFRQVVARLTGEEEPAEQPQQRPWIAVR